MSEEKALELEGDIELKGFLAISDKIRPGYQEIRLNFKVKMDIDKVEKLKELTGM